MRTQGAFFADTPHSGGWIFYNALELAPAFSANLLLTRNALGDYSLNRTAAGAETYNIPQGILDLKRLIADSVSGMPYQEQFGTAAGATGYPAGAAGIPPFTGATQLTPATALTPKGIKVTDVVAVYLVGVAALTAASFSLNRTVFANNVANAITNVPVDATALPLATQANPYVVTRAVTTPVFETTDLSDLTLEFSITMQNTGTIRIYGVGFHCQFNYN